MPEINEQKENYMSIDDFLTKYYAVFENKDYENTLFNRIMWETASKKPEDFDKWYQRLKDYIKPEESKELYAEIAKAMKAGTFEAQRFLNMVKTLTIFDNTTDKRPASYEIQNAAQRVFDSIKTGYITNPSNSYKLLKHISREYGYNEILRKQYNPWVAEVAVHPMAEPGDMSHYLGKLVDLYYNGAPRLTEEAEKSVSPEFIHKIVQVFDRMCTRISKEIDKIKAEKTFDLRERLEKLGVSYIGPVAKALLGIISCQINRGADKQEFASEINLLKNAIAEFNIENIMAFMTRDSQQEFEESDRMKLAKLEEEYKKLQEESKNELNAAKQREQKLTKDLQNEKSKVDLYQGRASLSEGHADNVEKELESLKQLMDQINIDIEQSRGLPIRRWRALKEMFQKLFDKFGKSEQKIKIDKKIYKQGYDQLMSNFHNNGGHLDI